MVMQVACVAHASDAMWYRSAAGGGARGAGRGRAAGRARAGRGASAGA